MYLHKQLSCHFEQCSLCYGLFSVQKWPCLNSFQGNRPKNSGRSLASRVGVSNEGRRSPVAIRPSKECKWVGNKACAMPWCYGMGVLEVKTSRFQAMFQHDRSDRGGKSAKQAGFAPQ